MRHIYTIGRDKNSCQVPSSRSRLISNSLEAVCNIWRVPPQSIKPYMHDGSTNRTSQERTRGFLKLGRRRKSRRPPILGDSVPHKMPMGLLRFKHWTLGVRTFLSDAKRAPLQKRWRHISRKESLSTSLCRVFGCPTLEGTCFSSGTLPVFSGILLCRKLPKPDSPRFLERTGE